MGRSAAGATSKGLGKPLKPFGFALRAQGSHGKLEAGGGGNLICLLKDLSGLGARKGFFFFRLFEKVEALICARR